jgi:hypothetical protein
MSASASHAVSASPQIKSRAPKIDLVRAEEIQDEAPLLASVDGVCTDDGGHTEGGHAPHASQGGRETEAEQGTDKRMATGVDVDIEMKS